MYQTQPSEQLIAKATSWITGMIELLAELEDSRKSYRRVYRQVLVADLQVGDFIKLNINSRKSTEKSSVNRVVGIKDWGAMSLLLVHKKGLPGCVYRVAMKKDWLAYKDCTGGLND